MHHFRPLPLFVLCQLDYFWGQSRFASFLQINRSNRHADSRNVLNPGKGDRPKIGSSGRIRTYDQSVNSRPLYH